MNGTALYRALVEAGASEERAREAAESVMYAKEGATRSDGAGGRSEVAHVRAELSERIAALEATMERCFRTMTFRLIGAMFLIQVLTFFALRFTGLA